MLNMFDDSIKFLKAIANLKPSAKYVIHGDSPTTEELFNKVEWTIGVNENDTAITTTDNPHPELTWLAVSAEMENVQTEYDAQEYARNRKAEYPSVEELVVALYDSDDKAAVDEKRSAVKLKYPKP